MSAAFKRSGVLAIHLGALSADETYPVGAAVDVANRDGVAVVQISGPLTNHAEPIEHGQPCFDNYDAIRARVAAALTSPARAVVMQINSPGGDAAGCFELSADLRAMADQCGKRLYAYADGMAASAAYAIACGAHEIYTSVTGTIGSVGVVTTMADVTAADAAAGLRIELVTSGARKADGNVHAAITDEAIAALQERVTDLAEIFFELVATSRGIPVASVRSLEGTVMHGARALATGLVDGNCSFNHLLAKAAVGSVRGANPQPKAKAMSKTHAANQSPIEIIRNVLNDPAASEEDKRQARTMLKAIEKPADEKSPEAKRAAAKFALSAHARLDAVEAKQARSVATASAATAAAAAEQAARAVEHRDLDARMGVRRANAVSRSEGTRTYLDVMTPKEARAEIARRAALEIGGVS